MKLPDTVAMAAPSKVCMYFEWSSQVVELVHIIPFRKNHQGKRKRDVKILN